MLQALLQLEMEIHLLYLPHKETMVALGRLIQIILPVAAVALLLLADHLLVVVRAEAVAMALPQLFLAAA